VRLHYNAVLYNVPCRNILYVTYKGKLYGTYMSVKYIYYMSCIWILICALYVYGQNMGAIRFQLSILTTHIIIWDLQETNIAQG